MITDKFTYIKVIKTTKVSDGMGSFTVSTTESNSEGYVALMSGSLIEEYGRLHPSSTDIIYCKDSLSIDDKIQYGDKQYQVIYVVDNPFANTFYLGKRL